MNPWNVEYPPVATDALFFNAARRTTFLLVEGGSDRCFWESYVDRRHCEIRVLGGRDKALKELATVLAAGQVAVAVLDADFDRLNGSLRAASDTVWTDRHDLEAILIASPALERVLLENASRPKLDDLQRNEQRSVRDGLVEKATEIGRLRWLSQRDGLQLVFRRSSNGELKYIDYQAFCDKASWELEPKRLVKEVLQFSVRHELQIDDLVQRMKQLPKADPWQLCVGHDLVGLLVVGLRKKIGTKNRTIDDLQRELRLAFHREDLEKTSMYRALRSWEQQHSPYRIFPS